MKMKYLLLSILALHFFSSTACTKKNPTPSKTDVYTWSKTTLEILSGAGVKELEDLKLDAVIPRDFEFQRRPNDFGEDISNLFVPDHLNTELIRNLGITSAIAEHCGINYETLNFLPMMQWQRTLLPSEERNGYKIYVIGLSHGYAMGRTDIWLETNQIDCEMVNAKLSGRLFIEKF